MLPKKITILLIMVLTITNNSFSQEQLITPNYLGVELRSVIEAVSSITGKNFIIDPRVRAEVTLLSSTPMSTDAFYEAFLSLLQVHGFVAVQAGEIIKIVPDSSSRQYPGYPNLEGAANDDIVTQVIKIQNISAAQLVPILRPLIPQYGHLAAHSGSNMLIISDRANNVDRILNIIQRIDQSDDSDIEIVNLNYASAAEIVRVLTVLAKAPRPDGSASQISLVADTRTNSVLIGGEQNGRLKIRALIAHLDTSLEEGDSTRVRYLRYADAEELAGKLLQHFSQQNRGSTNNSLSGSNENINVWADKQTNAIIVNAPPKMMRSLMGIVDQLDIRRLQVLVEAIIVEIVADRTSELGVTWATDGSNSDNVVGVTNFPSMGSGVVQLAAINNNNNINVNPTALINEGMSIGVGKITKEGTSFAAILNALEGIADTNIISTPSIVTTDNEEASLNVGQEVPFVTGSFSNTGSTGGAINPFQTIQREQVGVNLTITPQINEGDSILLKISQEISNISQSATGAVDLITNERTIDTTVIVDDGDILVLGGLLEDQLRESNQRVPILGSIPIIGTLFKSKKTAKVKTNLMVFIRPKILESPEQATYETNKKYNYIRDLQIEENKNKQLRKLRGQDIIGNTEIPVLPEIEN
ncbi:MAG: type II secretion system secretin GspD [Woeseiaceae bacterium]|nr:type II secretion system secretin GspD [Woeseiaceae bacterium]